MVSKSLTIIALLLCAILAQTAVAKKEESEDETSDGSGDEGSDGSGSESDDDNAEEEDAKYASLSCLIFENIGCNSECAVIGNAFNTKSSGTCADDNVCECNVAKETSFDDEDAGKFLKNGGKPDITAIKKHVSNKLPTTLKSVDIKNLSALNYEKILQDALKEAKDDSDAFDQLVVDIRRTKNESLGEILSQYLKKNKLKEPAKDGKDESSVADIMAYYVVDELVKKVDEKKSTKSVKKPANKPATKSGKTLAKKPSKKFTDDADDTTSLKDRFELEDFDDSILKGDSPVNKNWKENGYKVSYQRGWSGDVNINWSKGADKVSIQKAASSAVNQNWTFGKEKVKISLSKCASGAINENWNFGTSKYEYSKSASGYVNSNWTKGKSDNKLLKKYQQFIDAWCDANSSLIKKSYCVIYQK